jgi:hypothetical protein
MMKTPNSKIANRLGVTDHKDGAVQEVLGTVFAGAKNFTNLEKLLSLGIGKFY